MSWVTRFLEHNRGFIGNAAKNISPFLALTPLGIPGALAAGALGRAIQPGANIGSIAKSGLSNAAIGAGMQGGLGALKSAFAPSSSAAGAVYGGGATGSEIGGQVMGAGNAFTAGAHGPEAGMSLADTVGGALKGVGKFAADHPKALEMGLGALDPTQRNYMRAQTDAITNNTQLSRDEAERRRRMQDAMAPLYAAFMGQFQNMQQHPVNIAANPYGGGR